MPTNDRFLAPTTNCWQQLRATADYPQPPAAPYQYRYPARLPDGSYLECPLRALPDDPDHAVASLIANQASFAVVDALSDYLIAMARRLNPSAIIGLPTLGQVFAAPVARGLGLSDYLPLGYSRKFWYDEALSVPVRSRTSPGSGKRLYLDPNLLPRLRGERLVVVDDAVSGGHTLAAALQLLASVDAEVIGAVVAMRQGEGWRHTLNSPDQVYGVFDTPLFRYTPAGWLPL